MSTTASITTRRPYYAGTGEGYTSQKDIERMVYCARFELKARRYAAEAAMAAEQVGKKRGPSRAAALEEVARLERLAQGARLGAESSWRSMFGSAR